ncbi:glutathione-regulated potassium-efflux system protein KefC [Accumulibacter sp.]|uniref:glutathione-regulated potassium-efflux system protein KefC n=1 Tax=Accumulibacter sp. TaxID=2053492 RepID=UPI00262F7492|nr:glutathione-regulated potassium-efflux system protein KefC [Accumulibacter sp.]
MAELLHDALVYLAAAVVCVPLAKRSGLGSVLGYLIAGWLIGPWGLRLVDDVESTLHFAEFGVVLMLFLIGLELEVKRLFAMRRTVFGGGSLQMVACASALALCLLALGLPWQAALTTGLALALSSTAIAVQTMSERNLMTAPVGRSSFAVLLFQDIAAIPLIALVPFLGNAGGDGGAGWLGAVKAIGAIVGVVLIGRFLTRPLMRLIAKSEVREIFTAFALLLVIGIAQLMNSAGLSMALGAFLAGVLLASSEYRHALESDIAPFKGLLLGLFFIAVGMSIDFAQVIARPGLLTLVVVGLLVVKVAMLAAIAPRLDVPASERWLFAALLSQAGEFAFVVLGVAREANVLPRAWEGLLAAAVALSMAATPLLLIAFDRLTARRALTQRAADAIDDEGAAVIIAGMGRYGQIVGRVLLAQGVPITVLDHDPDQIETLRRYGYQVFYGDATRLDLLEAAGAARARLLVVAIDDVADSLALVDLAKASFPKLAIVARARNVRHWLELADRGVASIERETFESSLRSARQALTLLGVDPYEARQIAEAFRRHNLSTLETMLPHFRDEAKTVAIVKSGREELEENLRRDHQARQQGGAGGWH